MPVDDDFEDEYDCDPESSHHCWTCRGEGWGIRGDDWTNDDPVNDPDGEIERCPNCRGSGNAEDVWYW